VNYLKLLLCLALIGCASNNDEVMVSVVNKSSQTLIDVRIISGGDKFYLKGIKAGTNKKVGL
jgi:hypothetical protein